MTWKWKHITPADVAVVSNMVHAGELTMQHAFKLLLYMDLARERQTWKR